MNKKLFKRQALEQLQVYGRGGWIRTNACQDQNLVPYRLATPLYRTTCVLRTYFLRQLLKASVQHRNVTTARHETWQSVWKLAADFISLACVWEAPKHTSSSAGHACWNEFVQQAQSVTNFWITLLDHRLTVVMTAPSKKAANCNGRGITCQLWVCKYFRCTNRDLRSYHEEPWLGQFHRLQTLANALGKRCAASDENRYIGPQSEPQVGQPVFAKVQLPKMVEAEQSGGCVGAAATDAAAHGQTFEQMNVGAQRATAFTLQQARRADDQVAVVVDPRQLGMQPDFAIFTRAEAEFVAMVEKLEQRLQLVVTVGAASDDMQHQIEFGGRR